MSFTPPDKMIAFLLQKGMAAMDLYRAPQSGAWGAKSQASLKRVEAWWKQQQAPTASAGFSTLKAGFAANLPVGKPAQVGSMAHRMVAIAHGEVGVKEEGGNNRGSRIVEYQKATWLEPSPWPWCAGFLCWVFVRALEGHQLPVGVERPRTAGAWDFENWARKQGPQVRLLKPASEEKVRAGDIVCFTFSHIGLAAKDEEGGSVDTIEGNTGPSGGREGDGVWSKKRPKSKIRSIIRCDF